MATNTTSIYLEETLKKAIDAEVSKKSQPLESAKKRRTQFQREASAYESVREKLTVLNNASKELFGFRSPFKTLKGIGEGVGEYFDITAARDAERTPHTVEVKSVAKNHKFASRPISKSEQIPAGTVTVRVGGLERTIAFKGGSPAAFIKALEKELGEELKLTLVQKDRDNQVIVFDVIKTGIKNRFQVIKDESGVLKWLDLFGERRNLYLDYTFAKSRENELTVENDAEQKHVIRDDVLTLKPKNKISVPLSREAEVKPGLTISLLMRALSIPKKIARAEVVTNKTDGTDSASSVISSDSLAFDKLSGVMFGEITLDAETVVPFGDWAKPKVAAASNTNAAPTNAATNVSAAATNAVPETGAFNGAILGVGYVDANGTPKEKFFSITNINGNFQKYSVVMDSLFAEGDIIRRVIFYNPNEEHEVSYRAVVVENAKSAEIVSKHPVQDPENAKILIDGVAIERDSNDMKDVAGGVTVHPKKKTDAPKTFTLEPDKEVIVGRIVEFIKAYNNAMLTLNNATATPPGETATAGIDDMKKGDLAALADRLGIDHDDETSETELRRRIMMRGVFTGVFSINNVRQKVKDAVIVAYPTRLSRDLTLLAQIGVSAGKPGSDWETVKKGYLTIDEKLFLEQLDKNVEGAADLFGYDAAGGDGIIDDGAAFKLSELLTPYVRSRGILDDSSAMAKQKAKDEDKNIEKQTQALSDYRAKREMDYGRMQAEMKKGERMQRQLNMGGGDK